MERINADSDAVKDVGGAFGKRLDILVNNVEAKTARIDNDVVASELETPILKIVKDNGVIRFPNPLFPDTPVMDFFQIFNAQNVLLITTAQDTGGGVFVQERILTFNQASKSLQPERMRLQTFTNAARPNTDGTDVFAGMVIWNSDTSHMQVWDGAVWQELTQVQAVPPT